MMEQLVRFQVPDHVGVAHESFDGSEIVVEYDSNFGGSVTIQGTAQLDPGKGFGDSLTLNVDGRQIRSNGHVFSDNGRHLGTVESIEAILRRDVAIELVTKHMRYDVDIGHGETIVQAWDSGIIERDGFMEGTVSVSLNHVENTEVEA